MSGIVGEVVTTALRISISASAMAQGCTLSESQAIAERLTRPDQEIQGIESKIPEAVQLTLAERESDRPNFDGDYDAELLWSRGDV